MKTRRILRPLPVSLVVVSLLFIFGYVSQAAQSMKGVNSVMRLEPPSFVRSASAASDEATSEIGALLDQEAGISAYFKSPDAINLNQVRSQFRTIETETANYILGSVPVAGYAITYDAHVYVNTNGWVLAYYLAADPAGKIFDVNPYSGTSITSTKLQNVLSAIASAAGSPFSGATYYDFRYPNATNMMFVAGYTTSYLTTATFQINMPSSYGYYHRSWFRGGCSTSVSLNGTNLGSGEYGALTSSQLQPDIFNTFSVSTNCTGGPGKGGLVLIYRVP